MDLDTKMREFSGAAERVREQVARRVVGQADVVREVLLCVLAGGHALLEGAPGLGKTLLVRTLAASLQLDYSRIQFTPDLMPADVTGTNVLMDSGDTGRTFTFQRGPIFGNVVLADEINRATPKTQSALLEAMQEGGVTIAGTRHELPQPFFVLATQNPIEMEGTYPLPEAQLDRFFFKVLVPSPDEDSLVEIVSSTTGDASAAPEPVLDGARLLELRAIARAVPVAEPLIRWTAQLVRATQPGGDASAPAATRYLRHGAGVRAAQTMVLAAKANALLSGRAHVSFEDLRAVALPALRHRVILNFEGEAEGVSADAVISEVLDQVSAVPGSIAALS